MATQVRTRMKTNWNKVACMKVGICKKHNAFNTHVPNFFCNQKVNLPCSQDFRLSDYQTFKELKTFAKLKSVI